MSFSDKENNKKVLISSLFLITCIILAMLYFFICLQNRHNGVIGLSLILVPDVFLLFYSISSRKITDKRQFVFALAVFIYIVSLIVEITYYKAFVWYELCSDCILNIVLGIILIVLSCKGLNDGYILRYIILAIGIIAVRGEFDTLLGFVVTADWVSDSLVFENIFSFLHNAFYFIALFIITPVKNYKTRVSFEQNKTIEKL